MSKGGLPAYPVRKAKRSCSAGSHLLVGFAERSTARTISCFRLSPTLGLRIMSNAQRLAATAAVKFSL